MKLQLSTPPLFGVGYVCGVLDASLPYQQDAVFTVTKPDDPSNFKIALICDPSIFLEYVWAHANCLLPYKGNSKKLESLRRCIGGDIEGTVVRYLSECPGIIGEIYEEYSPDSCLLLDRNLDKALAEILGSVDCLPFATHVPRPYFIASTLSDNLQRRVRHAERRFCSWFDFF